MDDAQKVLQRCRALSQQALTQSKRFAGEWDAIREELDTVLDKLKGIKERVNSSDQLHADC
jgi:hypothetical protein